MGRPTNDAEKVDRQGRILQAVIDLLARQGIEELQQAVRDVHPLRRYGTPDDVAGLVWWLSSGEARYAAGQLWVLDGGLTAQVQQMRL